MIIAVECNADEKFVRTLLPEYGNRIIHLDGKGKIINRLRKTTTDSGAGLIDEDPGSIQPRDFKNNYIEVESIGAVKRFRHKEKPGCSVVMLCPRLEEWFIYKANVIGIQLSDYKLPDDGEKLHSLIHYERSDNFNEFLSKLTSSNDEEIKILRKWLMDEK